MIRINLIDICSKCGYVKYSIETNVNLNEKLHVINECKKCKSIDCIIKINKIKY